MELNYYDTLITVADDCAATRATPPPGRAANPTVAQLQYELLAESPFTLTQEDVLFESWFARQEGVMDADRPALREQFFSRSQACLRASPLPKQYGWGLLFDHEGRIALLPMESEEYRRLAAGANPELRVLKAMRSKRAR